MTARKLTVEEVERWRERLAGQWTLTEEDGRFLRRTFGVIQPERPTRKRAA